MKRKLWQTQEKLKIVLEGLSGQIEISKLCQKYQLNQAQYYQWRDLLLKFGHQAFETKDQSKKEARLEMENQPLKRIIGDLTVDLKKTEYELNG